MLKWSMADKKRKIVETDSLFGIAARLEVPAFKPSNGKNIKNLTTSLPISTSKNNKASRRRHKLWVEQGGICAYCPKALQSGNHGTLDHVKPKSKGGGKDMENLVLACPECNALKGWFESYAEALDFSERLMAFFRRLRDKGLVP